MGVGDAVAYPAMTSTTLSDCSPDSSPSSLIKTDKLGRLRTSPERREMLLDEFEGSGMSGPQFAAMIGVKYQTFCGWRQRRTQRRQSGAIAKVPTQPPLQLVEAVVAPKPDVPHPDPALIIHLPGAARMELSDAGQIPLACAVLKSLQRSVAPC